MHRQSLPRRFQALARARKEAGGVASRRTTRPIASEHQQDEAAGNIVHEGDNRQACARQDIPVGPDEFRHANNIQGLFNLQIHLLSQLMVDR
jgi:hypothetical protein